MRIPYTRLAIMASSAVLAACGSAPAEVDAHAGQPVAACLDGPAEIASPDGRITMQVWSDHGAPRYAVSHDGEAVVSPSRLGFRFVEAAALESDLCVTETATASVDTEWEQPWGERRIVRDHHNEIRVSFRRRDNAAEGFDVRVRAFDTGVGFRYEVLADGPRAIIDELTRFNLPEDSTAWWIPAAGWNRYEYIYERSEGLGELDRVHTPFTAQLPEGGPYVSIHEAALVDYSGMYLDQRRGGVMEAALAPDDDGVKVRTDGDFITPWRTIQIADEAVGLINSDIILNLNEPNVLGDVSWVEPGKYVGIWWSIHVDQHTWSSGDRHGATTERTMEYVDFAAENGFSGVLVEGWNLGWDGDWFGNRGVNFSFTETMADFDLEAAAAYARENGVRLVGHHETSANITNYEEQMEAGFDLYQQVGVAQVKTGYVTDGGDFLWHDENGQPRYGWHYGQRANAHFIHVLEQAAERQISINTHEPVKDTGLRRTYPNWISREGARGQEYNAWGNPPNPPEHIPMLSFTRMLSGPMDFTPGIFDLMPRGEDHPSRVETTLAQQLAHYVIIYSPIQMAADTPENYLARPDAFQFIRDVPTDWEQSIALDGEPGEFIVFARQERGGPDWYVGAATNGEGRELHLDLDFLGEGQWTVQIYRDGPDAHWESNPYDIAIHSMTMSPTDELAFGMAPGGGAALRFTPLVEE